MMTVMKIVRASARLLLANTCLCKMHLEFILFNPIMNVSGRPTGGRLNYGQKHFSVQCYQVAEVVVCHVTAGEERPVSLSLAMGDHFWQTIFNLILSGFRVN